MSELRLPEEWEAIEQVRILDPDGWRFNCKPYLARPWDERITREEFLDRANSSTCETRTR